MRSQRFITDKHSWAVLAIALALLTSSVAAQRLAVLAPDRGEHSLALAGEIGEHFGAPVRVLDADMAMAAFAADLPPGAFNMTTVEARAAGARIGADMLLIVRSDVLRRSSSRRAEYYEAYAALYLVSTRTGRLVNWRMLTFEADKPDGALEKLHDSLPAAAQALQPIAAEAYARELKETPSPPMDEPPEPGSAAAAGVRSPLPYRRLKPEYTQQASLFGITATVEITVDLDAEGRILRTEITRWAGYGLDESVEQAVRSMTWRPADRNGHAIPMRFTLQYNFKKVEKP